MFKTFNDDFGLNLNEVLITISADSKLAQQLIEAAEKEKKVINCCRGKKRVSVALLRDGISVLILPIKISQLLR